MVVTLLIEEVVVGYLVSGTEVVSLIYLLVSTTEVGIFCCFSVGVVVYKGCCFSVVLIVFSIFSCVSVAISFIEEIIVDNLFSRTEVLISSVVSSMEVEIFCCFSVGIVVSGFSVVPNVVSIFLICVVFCVFMTVGSEVSIL